MANMMDYLLWRGDLAFSQSEFNEVDNLIFSELVYVDFSDIVPSPNQGKITVKKASELFFQNHTEEEIYKQVSSTKMAAFLLREMAKTKRFGELLLSDYVEDISAEEESQFCAMTISLDEECIFVSYSGTDNTMTGWKENFNMSFLSETPGQLKAVKYLESVINDGHKQIRLGGHSKGGNLAVYASVRCKDSIGQRILAVYSNDGPGFTESMISKDAYSKMLSRIHTFVPESSIVGMLLEHEEEYRVIKSSKTRAMQHDAMTWEVLGTSFIYLDAVANQSILLNKTLKAWVGKLEQRQREIFVNELFDALEETNIKTIDDLAKIKGKKIIELLKVTTALDRENDEVIDQALRMLWAEGNQIMKDALKKRMELEDPFKRNKK